MSLASPARRGDGSAGRQDPTLETKRRTTTQPSGNDDDTCARGQEATSTTGTGPCRAGRQGAAHWRGARNGAGRGTRRTRPERLGRHTKGSKRRGRGDKQNADLGTKVWPSQYFARPHGSCYAQSSAHARRETIVAGRGADENGREAVTRSYKEWLRRALAWAPETLGARREQERGHTAGAPRQGGGKDGTREEEWQGFSPT